MNLLLHTRAPASPACPAADKGQLWWVAHGATEEQLEGAPACPCAYACPCTHASQSALLLNTPARAPQLLTLLPACVPAVRLPLVRCLPCECAVPWRPLQVWRSCCRGCTLETCMIPTQTKTWCSSRQPCCPPNRRQQRHWRLSRRRQRWRQMEDAARRSSIRRWQMQQVEACRPLLRPPIATLGRQWQRRWVRQQQRRRWVRQQQLLQQQRQQQQARERRTIMMTCWLS